MADTDITAAYLRETYNYDPASGCLTKKHATGPKPLGAAVGYTSRVGGYLYLEVRGKVHRLHRLIWLHVHGSWPVGVIDHINGVRGDNRLCNLRDVSVAVNGQNQQRPPKHNTTGVMGVSWCRTHKKFIAQITTNNRRKFLGYFDDANLAGQAYIEAKRVLHGGCVI